MRGSHLSASNVRDGEVVTPAMVADAARAFRPRILYPYHFGNTDTAELAKLLADEKGIEVRIRRLP